MWVIARLGKPWFRAPPSGGRDGANIISFTDTARNRMSFEIACKVVGLALFFFNAGNLTEADVLFNPRNSFSTTAESPQDLTNTGQVDVQSVALHELGIVIGPR